MCRTLLDAKIASIGYTTSTVAVEIRVPSRGMRQTDVLMGRETMSKWIDADAISRKYVIAELSDLADEFSELDENELHSERWCGITDAKQVVVNAPSIDIVRCHECEHGTWHEQTEMYICSANDQDLYEAGHFCSYGERREP